MLFAVRVPGVTTGEIWAAGLGAAVVTGITSALVAWWVVKLSADRRQKHARETQAEERATDLISELFAAVTAMPLTGNKVDAQVRLTELMIRTLAASLRAEVAVSRVDEPMQELLAARRDQLVNKFATAGMAYGKADQATIAENNTPVVDYLLQFAEDVRAWLRTRRPLRTALPLPTLAPQTPRDGKERGQ